MTDRNELKRAAAARALDFVSGNMKLGLGSGTTAELFVEMLAEKVRGWPGLRCVPTSERTAGKARSLGLTLADLGELAPLDLVVDGADEADRDLNLIKGGGGMLLREKLVAASSKKMIVIADESKLVPRLGRFPLPVEVVEFGHKATADRLAGLFSSLGHQPALTLRQRAGVPFKTDGGNLIYDCPLGAIRNARTLSRALDGVTGVVEHGLFVGLAHILLIACPGEVQVLEK